MSFTFKKQSNEVNFVEANQVEHENVSLADLIARFNHMEKLCEDALTELDEVARQFYSRSVSSSRDLVEIKSGELEERNQISISDLAFDDFRHLSRLAQTVVPHGLPNASQRFVINGCSPEVEKIEYLEETVKIYRFRMSALEAQILEFIPSSTVEALTKLKFTASLMMNGGEIEIDYFAYLVDECASVIAATMRRG
jgi:hypothetical protein